MVVRVIPETWRGSWRGPDAPDIPAPPDAFGPRCRASYNFVVPRTSCSGPFFAEPAMSDTLPVVYLARHGETAWSLSGQHTGLTDLPLTERGERNARSLGERLAKLRFATVLTSGLQRADRTCELAGFKANAEVDANLVEWDYGDYEGRRSVEILTE